MALDGRERRLHGEPLETREMLAGDPPVGAPDTFLATEDTQLVMLDLTKSVLLNDRDTEGDRLTAQLADNVTTGVLSFNPLGVFVYTPPANFFGPVTFTYRATDGTGQSEPVTVTIDVQSVNDMPTAQPDGYLMRPGERLEISAEKGVLSNDQDLEDTQLQAVLLDGPSHGSLTLRPDGSLSYQPEAGFTGGDSFRYVARDSSDATEPVTVQIGVTNQPVEINEFMAQNTGTVQTRVKANATDRFRGDRQTYDWIELRNTLPFEVDISGMYLTDDPDQPTRWQFPEGTKVAGNGYLVVYASAQNVLDPALDETGRLHTNFKLSSAGEFLALADTNGTIVQQFNYPMQKYGISYGLDAAREIRYLLTPTVAAENVSESLVGMVASPTIVANHGFFTGPIQVVIDNADPAATIRYTLDGSTPTSTNGVDYAGPLTITSTSVLRAAAFRTGYLPSRIDTRTYVFLDDVLTQSADGTPPTGWPVRWGSNKTDYGMDPDIVNDPTWGPLLKEALTQIPTMSVVTDVANMFDARTGIYSRPSGHGFANERPGSLELINPDGSIGFQTNVGIRIRGGFSRDTSNPKHALRMFFDSPYGDGTLNFPLFGDEGADHFAKVDLRTTQNYSWAFQNDARNTFLRDIYSRDLQGAMGQPYSRGRHYHLYINGQYWGLYQTDERIDSNYAASYLGGEPEDYDIAHNDPRNNEATDGNLDAYRRLWEQFTKPGGLSDANMVDYYRAQGMNPDGTRNPAYERLLDVDNLMDYMIITYYTSDADGPGSKFTRPGLNNYFASYNRENPDGWKFYEHDSEHSMDTGNAAGANYNMVTPFLTNGTQFATFNPHWMHEQLANKNSDYLTRFRDRVAKLFADDGLLSDTKVHEMLDKRAAEINMAIIAESARWGDAQRPTNPYTKRNWETAVTNLKRWVTRNKGRRADVLAQFTSVKWWYPNTLAPTLSQAGGQVDPGFPLSITTSGQGDIYVTTDGSDPRASGGQISSKATKLAPGQTLPISTASLVRARVLNGTEWSTVAEGNFLVEPAASLANVRITEVHFNPGAPTTAETEAGFSDNDDFEFVELLNFGSTPVDISGMKLQKATIDGQVRGIAFDFSSLATRLLQPGEYLVVAENPDAFRLRYGSQKAVVGPWDGGLSNSLDTLTLVYRDGSSHQFTYSDVWYASADGQGSSLEIGNPSGDPALWGTSLAWQPSRQINGTPGTSSRTPGDSNGDGRFDAADLLQIFSNGEYEDATSGNSTFAEGDWNDDGDFNSADLVFAFAQGFYADLGLPVAAAAADWLWPEDGLTIQRKKKN